jgi:hypothetical protein
LLTEKTKTTNPNPQKPENKPGAGD